MELIESKHMKKNITSNLITLTKTVDHRDVQPPPWAEVYSPRYQIPQVLKRITCFKNIQEQGALPSIAVTNIRSLGPKIQNFIQDLKLREIDLALISETWGSDDKKGYRNKILAMLEMDGLGTISLNRKTRKGGGVALVYETSKIAIQEVPVMVPFNLEIKWSIGRPMLGKIKTYYWGLLLSTQK